MTNTHTIVRKTPIKTAQICHLTCRLTLAPNPLNTIISEADFIAVLDRYNNSA